MMHQPIAWDGPGDIYLTALVRGGFVSLYLCNEDDEYVIQDIAFDDFKKWASTVLAEVALVEREEADEPE